METNFNNYDLTIDDQTIFSCEGYLSDYPNQIPEQDDDYSVSCYIEEYNKNGKLCARLRDKHTNKKIVFWTSPHDELAYEQKNDLLSFLSETKKMNNPEFYKKDGKAWIMIQAILLSETKDIIELASYCSELFYGAKGNWSEPFYEDGKPFWI